MSDPRFSFAEAVSGADEAELRDRLGGTRIRIEITPDAIGTLPGQVLMYQLSTLTARLFDRVELEADSARPTHRHFPLFTGPFLPELRALLPTLRKVTTEPPNGRVVRVLIGDENRDHQADLYLGAVDWTALVSTQSPRPVCESVNPCGALAAGALGAGEVFKIVFDGRLKAALRVTDVSLSLLTYAQVSNEAPCQQPALPERVEIGSALVGCGSVGCAFLQGFLFTPELTGELALIDNGVFDGRNPYKYALLDWRSAEKGPKKVEWARDLILRLAGDRLRALPFVGTAEQYVASLPEDYRILMAISAVDTMEARLEIQDMLPRSIVNGGISGTTVEVSSHDFGPGPCLGCLTMREMMESWSGEALSTRTGLRPERVLQLIRHNEGISMQDINDMIIAQKLPEKAIVVLLDYEGQPLLSFWNRIGYAETSVAGANGGPPARVTTAFVSAFAGALLFAEFLKASVPELAGYRVDNSYRQDLLGIPTDGLCRYERDPEGWCSCYSPFRHRVYKQKYGTIPAD